jgi:hypothetical protein
LIWRKDGLAGLLSHGMTGAAPAGVLQAFVACGAGSRIDGAADGEGIPHNR